MDWDRRRFDDRRGGESYRPADRPGRSPSRGYDARDNRNRRSPPRNRSRLCADTWVPSSRGYGRPRSRSPDYRRRSRTPPFQGRGYGPAPYTRRRSPPRRFSPRRDDRPRSPPPSWRSKSPHSEGRSRDVSRGRRSPGRNRDVSPGSQDVRSVRRDNAAALPLDEKSSQASTSKIQHNPPPIRPSSPSQNVPRREPAVDVNRSLPYSRARQLSPSRTSRPESSSTSRRSSPSGGPERGGQTPLKNRSRSPSHFSPAHRFSAPSGNITPQDRGFTHDTEGKDSTRIYGNTDRLESDSTEPNQRRFGANPPTQPRSLGLRQSPPSGPSQGPRKIPSQPRGSQNYPFLSAPTRPRRGPSSRDGPWPSGTMSRRGPPTTPSQTPPSGPRASFSSGFPGGSNFRHPGSRQNSTVPASPSLPTPKAPNHLAGLCTVIPGGKLLPPVLDGVSEKRLSQLEADQEKLVEQMAEVQRSKRAVLRDWDRLDHESSICALKSELAEGHLQRMADETIGGGIPF